jgi:AraC-like DNA-binding protein
LLREGMTIAEVIDRVGYYDQAHLTRALRRFVGQTPGRIARESRAA